MPKIPTEKQKAGLAKTQRDCEKFVGNITKEMLKSYVH